MFKNQELSYTTLALGDVFGEIVHFLFNLSADFCRGFPHVFELREEEL